MKKPISIYKNVLKLKDRTPTHAIVENTDLVIVKFDDKISVLYGRCLHRGALMSDGHVDGNRTSESWTFNSEGKQKFFC